ncbi:MAG: hypothetical protein RLZZ182_2347 [Pseudomonadota bacterium]|jgi:AcrR family transcriptional regulator
MSKHSSPRLLDQAAPVPLRRKPRQHRSRATADAITEAFLQLLVEQGYDKVSIRQIVHRAGVGIGSFYEYFDSKLAVAAVCVHQHVMRVARRMNASVGAHAHAPLPVRVDALIEAQLHDVLAEPERWAAILRIERQVSPVAVYQRVYGEFAQIWARGLSAGPDWPEQAPLQASALSTLSIAYGMGTHTLLAFDHAPDAQALRQQVQWAVHGYLSVLAPHAYRGHAWPAMPGQPM